MRQLRRRIATLVGALALGAGSIGGLIAVTTTPAGAAPTCVGTTTVTCTYLSTSALDTFVVPAGVTSVTITADGAQGAAGDIGVSGGEGAVLESTFTVTPGSTLNVLVGGTGGRVSDSGGGGGGSFVYTTADAGGLLIAAAGGGGSAGDGAGSNARASAAASNGQNGFAACDGGPAGTGGNGGGAATGICPVAESTGGGGGGLSSNGADGVENSTGSGGLALVNGGTGGASVVGASGGFGGGGGAGGSGGGGGGYNGGGGGADEDTGGGGGGSYSATLPILAESGANAGSGQVVITYTAPSTSPPTISKSFGAGSIPLGGQTSLRFTITNPNSGSSLTDVGFTDPLPSGLVVAAPSNGLSGSCGGGTITAAPDSGSISLSGATLAASGSCTFSVNVIGVASGPQVNTTGEVTSNEGGTGNAATTSLGVLGCPKGETAYLFTGTTKAPSTIVGVFCVTKTGQATYQQGTASGSGAVNVNGSSNAIVALGTGMNLAGGTSGPTSQFTEVLPIKATGTYVLNKIS